TPSTGADHRPKGLRALVLLLLAPLVAAAIGSLLRWDVYLPDFDAPARFALAIPALLFAVRVRLDAARVLRWMLPAALAVTLAQQYVVVQPHHWGPERMSTYFADPLVFGYVSLAFGMMCLMSIRPAGERRGEPPALLALQLAGLLVGLYL